MQSAVRELAFRFSRKIRFYRMTKSKYIEIRTTLDFGFSYRWLVIHIASDLILLSFPILWAAQHVGLSTVSVVWGLASAIPLAAFYFRSFSMMHEAVHGAILPARKWNDLLGLFYGIFCFLPFVHWKQIHLLHHQWAGNVEKDPVMKLVLDFRKPSTPTREFLSLLWRSWFPILAILQTYVFWTVSISRFWQDISLSRFMSLVLPVTIWGAAFAFADLSTTLLVTIPSILLYLATVEVINFPHHMNLPQYEGETKLALWDQYKIARSCIYSRFLARGLLLNFNYHVEHHLYPTLPWHQLDKLSERLHKELVGYNFTMGNQWILQNRVKPLEEVSRAPKMRDQDGKVAI